MPGVLPVGWSDDNSKNFEKTDFHKVTGQDLLSIFQIKVDASGKIVNADELEPLMWESISDRLLEIGEFGLIQIKIIVREYNRIILHEHKNIGIFLNNLEELNILDLQNTDIKLYAENLNELNLQRKSCFLKKLSKDIFKSGLWILGSVLKILRFFVKFNLRIVFCILSLIIVLLISIFKFIFGPSNNQKKQMTIQQWRDFGQSRFRFAKYELTQSWKLIFKAILLNGGDLYKVINKDIEEREREYLDIYRYETIDFSLGHVPSVFTMSDLQKMFLG